MKASWTKKVRQIMWVSLVTKGNTHYRKGLLAYVNFRSEWRQKKCPPNGFHWWMQPMQEWIMVKFHEGNDKWNREGVANKEELGQLTTHCLKLLKYNLTKDYVEGIGNIHLHDHSFKGSCPKSFIYYSPLFHTHP
jgi:hypothetical protein